MHYQGVYLHHLVFQRNLKSCRLVNDESLPEKLILSHSPSPVHVNSNPYSERSTGVTHASWNTGSISTLLSFSYSCGRPNFFAIRVSDTLCGDPLKSMGNCSRIIINNLGSNVKSSVKMVKGFDRIMIWLKNVSILF